MPQTPRSPTPSEQAGHLRRCVDAVRAQTAPATYPMAACVVMGNDVLALECSSLPRTSDPTAHPEMAAIRAAAARMGRRYLPGAVLYSTVEPCPMCAAAAIWARMDGIVYGVSQAEVIAFARTMPAGAMTWRQIRIPASAVAEAGSPKLWVVGGVLREECLALLPLTLARNIADGDGGG